MNVSAIERRALAKCLVAGRIATRERLTAAETNAARGSVPHSVYPALAARGLLYFANGWRLTDAGRAVL